MSARTLARRVRIGQRWTCDADGIVLVVYQVHRADRTVEAHVEGDDPHRPGARFQLAFRELTRDHRLLDGERARGAA